MRAETAAVAEIAEQPTDWQHADQCDYTHNAEWNVALGDRQRVGLSGLARMRGGNRTGEPTGNWLYQFQQRTDRRNADCACAEDTHFVTPSTLRERGGAAGEIGHERGVVRDAPAPADQCAYKHCNTN